MLSQAALCGRLAGLGGGLSTRRALWDEIYVAISVMDSFQGSQLCWNQGMTRIIYIFKYIQMEISLETGCYYGRWQLQVPPTTQNVINGVWEESSTDRWLTENSGLSTGKRDIWSHGRKNLALFESILSDGWTCWILPPTSWSPRSPSPRSRSSITIINASLFKRVSWPQRIPL